MKLLTSCYLTIKDLISDEKETEIEMIMLGLVKERQLVLGDKKESRNHGGTSYKRKYNKKREFLF